MDRGRINVKRGENKCASVTPYDVSVRTRVAHSFQTSASHSRSHPITRCHTGHRSASRLKRRDTPKLCPRLTCKRSSPPIQTDPQVCPVFSSIDLPAPTPPQTTCLSASPDFASSDAWRTLLDPAQPLHTFETHHAEKRARSHTQSTPVGPKISSPAHLHPRLSSKVESNTSRLHPASKHRCRCHDPPQKYQGRVSQTNTSLRQGLYPPLL